MRQDIENPIVKEPAAVLTVGYQDILAEHHKLQGMSKYMDMWKETEQHGKGQVTKGSR